MPAFFFVNSRTATSLLAIFLGLSGVSAILVFWGSDTYKQPNQVLHSIGHQKQAVTKISQPLAGGSNPRGESGFFKPAEQETIVPFGAKLPAVFFDMGSTGDNADSEQLLLSLEQEFQEQYGRTVQRGASNIDAWEMARANSDERYRALFGETAYLEALNSSAEEAESDWQDSNAANHP